MSGRNMTPERLCVIANTAYERLSHFADESASIGHWFAHEAGLVPGSCWNPCDATIEIGRLIDQFRRYMAHYVIRQLNKMLVPNIPLNCEAVRREIPACHKKLNAYAILKHMRRKYVRNGREMSLEALLARASQLLPRTGGKKTLSLARILRKNVLVLHKEDCNDKCSYARGCECNSLQKIVRIVLENADPLTVTTGVTPISEIQRARKCEELFQEITFRRGWIRKVRFFKNGKVLVTMKDETAAERIAKLLLATPRTPEPPPLPLVFA